MPIGESSKRVAAVQSNYIPWKGYFDLVNSVDEFILLDHVQYTRRDWRNRNRIKTVSGLRWLTIPVQVKGRFKQTIDETRVSETNWASRHLATLQLHYRRAPHFETYCDFFSSLYASCKSPFLSQINRSFLEAVCGLLGIETRFTTSRDFVLPEDKTQRLVELCRQVGGEVYVSGPSARDYLDEKQFADAGIRIEYFNYSGYPEYPQAHPPFEHQVTIIDLLFNTGPDAPRFMKSFGALPRARSEKALSGEP